jgi:hypothetical protein
VWTAVKGVAGEWGRTGTVGVVWHGGADLSKLCERCRVRATNRRLGLVGLSRGAQDHWALAACNTQSHKVLRDTRSAQKL